MISTSFKPVKHTKWNVVTVVSFVLLSGNAYGNDEILGNDDDLIVTGENRSEESDARKSLTRQYKNSLSVQYLKDEELIHRRQSGLGETLAGLPGIHLDSYGGGASRPVIRGQTLPRVAVLSDGATIYDVSSISPDHTVATDPLLLDEIEIIKGPAATIYGGNALNGAINLIDSKVPKSVPDDNITGSGELRYGTGDHEKTGVGRITAGAGNFAFHVEGSSHDASDYRVPSSYGANHLKDSYSNNKSTSVGASWITEKGYIGAAYTLQRNNYGLPGHTHENNICHTHASTKLHCALHNGDVDPFADIDDSDTAFIDLRSERYDIRADYDSILPGIEHARVRFSHTNYNHNEIDGGTLFANYNNKVRDIQIELTHVPVYGFSGMIGYQYTESFFSGLDDNTVQVPAPEGAPRRLRHNFLSDSHAFFISEKKSLGPLDVELGARKEFNHTNIDWPFWREFAYNDSDLNPLSLSFGTTWHFDDSYSLSLDISRTQRAPSVRELYTFGNNLSTNTLEAGLITGRNLINNDWIDDHSKVIETAKSVNLTLRKSKGYTTFEVGGFYQDIHNYVYGRLLDKAEGRDFMYLMYTPADVVFMGVDGEVKHYFDYQTSASLFGDYVYTELKSENDKLPRVSPARLGVRLYHDFVNFNGEVEFYHTFTQNRHASYETKTSGYNMLNMTLSRPFEVGDFQNGEIYLRGTNLTNTLAYAHWIFISKGMQDFLQQL